MQVKKFYIIFILIFSLQLSFTESSWAFNLSSYQTFSDTTIKDKDQQEDKAIDEVIKSPIPPKKEKVQYFNQVTRYGFKNLFKNYSYDPAMPYSSQVNPYAETYMQD